MTESRRTSLLDFSLDGKVAVVTGGASGIGAAVAEAYPSKGATVVVLDRDLGPVRELVGRAASADIPCDVTQEASVAAAVAAVTRQFGTIDVLVNSAGVAVLGPAEDLALEAWDATMSVNLRGAFLMSQHVGRRMLSRGRGTVISIASQAANGGAGGPRRLLRLQVRPGRDDEGARSGVGRSRRHRQHD